MSRLCEGDRRSEDGRPAGSLTLPAESLRRGGKGAGYLSATLTYVPLTQNTEDSGMGWTRV